MLGNILKGKTSLLLAFVRIYIGSQWFLAGWNKISGSFDASGFIKIAIERSEGLHPTVPTWYATFLKHIIIPNMDFFNFLIPWGEFLIGIGLIFGFFTIASLSTGVFMNANFLLAGETLPNLTFYTFSILLLLAGKRTYRIGLDYYLLPILKEILFKGEKRVD